MVLTLKERSQYRAYPYYSQICVSTIIILDQHVLDSHSAQRERTLII